MIKDKRIKSLLEKYKTIYSLKYLLLLSNWDIETYMPKKAIYARGIVSGKIEALIQELSLQPEFVSELKGLYEYTREKDIDLSDEEKAIIRTLWHTHTKYTKLPRTFVEEYTNLVSTSSTVWAKAKNKNDYEIFKPSLKKIIDMTLEYCNYIGFKNHPYEALITDYEPGMTMDDYESYFVDLKNVLSQFNIHKLNQVKKLPDSYSVIESKKLISEILKFFKSDEVSFRLDESEHPFTNSIGTNDVRLTTNYTSPSPFSEIYSTIHEFGHGLFGLQTSEELEFTPLFYDISYGLHESQSRYWENVVGRGKDFIHWLKPKLSKLNEVYKSFSEDDIYDIVNKVQPSLIRIEADELTYHYHILIRFEVEKALLEKKITVDEAPEFWNSKYMEYLGIRPGNFSEGILQDIHWSIGALGYFPSYSFGTVLAAAIGEKNKPMMSEIDKTQKWLKENIHKYGGTYTYPEVSLRLTGKRINLAPWENYMKEKFNNLLIN